MPDTAELVTENGEQAREALLLLIDKVANREMPFQAYMAIKTFRPKVESSIKAMPDDEAIKSLRQAREFLRELASILWRANVESAA